MTKTLTHPVNRRTANSPERTEQRSRFKIIVVATALLIVVLSATAFGLWHRGDSFMTEANAICRVAATEVERSSPGTLDTPPGDVPSNAAIARSTLDRIAATYDSTSAQLAALTPRAGQATETAAFTTLFADASAKYRTMIETDTVPTPDEIAVTSEASRYAQRAADKIGSTACGGLWP